MPAAAVGGTATAVCLLALVATVIVLRRQLKRTRGNLKRGEDGLHQPHTAARDGILAMQALDEEQGDDNDDDLENISVVSTNIGTSSLQPRSSSFHELTLT